MSNVSIVVLQFNQSDRTLACLESLRALDADVIVVDNASDVQHLKNVEFWIEARKILNFKLLILNENGGYSAGNNAGIKQALENGAEQILILNNDTIVPPDFLAKLTAVSADIVGVEEGSVFGFRYFAGVALLIKRRVFEKIGFFDERYFLYYEDVEFCVRARKAGFTLALANTPFSHAISASTKTLGAPALLYYHTRNAFLLLKTHGSWYVRLALPLWAFWIMLKQRVKLILRKNPAESSAILKGVKDYYANRWYRM